MYIAFGQDEPFNIHAYVLSVSLSSLSAYIIRPRTTFHFTTLISMSFGGCSSHLTPNYKNSFVLELKFYECT